MVTLKFHDQDIPFLFAAIREHTSTLLDSMAVQIDMQRNAQQPQVREPQIQQSEIKVEAPPVEATITPRRGPGRPKGRKDSVKRRPLKRGVAK